MEMPITSEFNLIGSLVKGFGCAYQGR